MAFELHRYQQQQALKAASNLPAHAVVALDSVQNQVIQSASTNSALPIGITGGSAGVGEAAVVYERTNIVRAIAGASLGYGAEVGLATVGVASSAQGGTTLATVTQLGPVAGASGSVVNSVGLAMEPAAAGEIFSVLINPRQLSGEA